MKLFSVNSHNTRSSNSLEIFKVLFHTIFTQSHLKITHNTQKKKKKKIQSKLFSVNSTTVVFSKSCCNSLDTSGFFKYTIFSQTHHSQWDSKSKNSNQIVFCKFYQFSSTHPPLLVSRHSWLCAVPFSQICITNSPTQHNQ